jgi:bifunctional DNA-binding transcriptional regulator/antitoxin component of YhaV-PrlF toxin-antitoxin module
VIPKELCETLHLREGDFVAFAKQPIGVLIKPKKMVDPDDVLTAEERKLLKKAEGQMRRAVTSCRFLPVVNGITLMGS